MRGLGFSLVEVLSPCPTIWKMSAVDAQHWVRDVMEKTYPLGVLCDRTTDAQPRPAPEPAASARSDSADSWHRAKRTISRIIMPKRARNGTGAAKSICAVRVAGFGGQGVLLLGEVLAEAGLDAGLEVSWLPSYGPEMRSGTSNCHVRLSHEPIDSPLVTVAERAAGNERAVAAQVRSERAAGRMGYLQRRRDSPKIASGTTSACWRSRSRRSPTNWANRAWPTW